MPMALRPENWLDWVIVVYVCLGLWQGLRRGLVLSLVGIAATVLVVLMAGSFGPRVIAAADARWHTEQRLEQYLGREMPLPDGAGQVPYSPASASVLRQDMGRAAVGPAGAALADVFRQPVPAPPPATLQGYFDDVVAAEILGTAGFLALFVAGEMAFHFIGTLFFARVARRGTVGLVNSGLGALFAMGERLVEVTAVLALVASLAAVPAATALEGILHHSRWAPTLLRAFQAAVPQSGKWLRWLA